MKDHSCTPRTSSQRARLAGSGSCAMASRTILCASGVSEITGVVVWRSSVVVAMGCSLRRDARRTAPALRRSGNGRAWCSRAHAVTCLAVATTPTDTHEWISFEDDEEERTWMFDVTFLTSNWTCIFGNGCQGVLTGPAPELVQGCCSYGAHLVNKKDARRVEKAAATLTPDEWQNHGTKKSVIHENKSGETVTRLVDDACIFLNKPDFPGGVGCAFHIAAMNRGVDHMTLKPEVCWQLPLRREDAVDDDEGHVTSVIRQWDRRHWGKGGREFHWWCTESPEAFVGTKPVYREMQPELTKMVGSKAYDHFVELVEERDRLRTKGVAVPHPAVRTRAGGREGEGSTG